MIPYRATTTFYGHPSILISMGSFCNTLNYEGRNDSVGDEIEGDGTKLFEQVDSTAKEGAESLILHASNRQSEVETTSKS